MPLFGQSDMWDYAQDLLEWSRRNSDYWLEVAKCPGCRKFFDNEPDCPLLKEGPPVAEEKV